jgi:hypothetical protein
MQVHATDPAYVASDDSHARFRAAALVSVMFVAALAFVHVISWALGLDLQRFGVHPRDRRRPGRHRRRAMLHGDVGPSRVERTPVADRGTRSCICLPIRSRTVLRRSTSAPASWCGCSAATRFTSARAASYTASSRTSSSAASCARPGARGRRRFSSRSSYGRWCGGVLPIKHGVSWETHLAAAAIGVVLAIALRPPRHPAAQGSYSWEVETEPAEEQGEELTSAADSPRAAG